MTVEVLIMKNGSAEFTCTACGRQVFVAIAHPGQKPVCAECQWIDRVATSPAERAELIRRFGLAIETKIHTDSSEPPEIAQLLLDAGFKPVEITKH